MTSRLADAPSTRVRWGRLLLGTVVAEVVPIALLIILVAFMGPRDPDEALDFANNLGMWVGPLGGATMAIIMARWVARPLPTGQVMHGVLLGVLLAVIDVVLLVAGGEPFAWRFVASNVGKIVAGALGGLIAARQASPVMESGR